MKTRIYELKRRAERQAETRRRIVQAAVALHTSVGPAYTTISSIAEQAGVQRQTVYAHFPDADGMFAACSQCWSEMHPFPDSSVWEGVEDPRRRLLSALMAIYGWYDSVAGDLQLFARDAALYPSLVAQRTEGRRRIATGLVSVLPSNELVVVSVAHALEFDTWRSLHRHGQSVSRAAELMTRFVCCFSDDRDLRE